MKHLNKIWGGAVILAIVALFVGMSFDKSATNTYVFEDENGVVHEYDFAPPKAYQKSFALDTLTGTTRDTVKIHWIMASPWQYEYYVKLRKLTGTPNTKILLQARTVTNGIWSPVDSVSCSGADSTKVHFRLRGTTV